MLSTSMTTFLLIHKEVNSCTELYLELQLPLVAHGRNVGGTKLFDKVASVYGVKTWKTGDWIPQILSNFHVYNLYNAQSEQPCLIWRTKGLTSVTWALKFGTIDKTYHTIDAMGPETELVVAAFSISFHIYVYIYTLTMGWVGGTRGADANVPVDMHCMDLHGTLTWTTTCWWSLPKPSKKHWNECKFGNPVVKCVFRSHGISYHIIS